MRYPEKIDLHMHTTVSDGTDTPLELAEKVIALTGSSSKVVFCDLPSDDPARRKPDISLAKEMLGWQPHVSVDEGIMKTAEFLRR